MERLFITLIMIFTAFMANAQSCPDANHPHAIDLGLPSGTKWACCNVGTTTPEVYGSYYAWGETEEKDIYDWTTYIHCDGSMETCHNIGSDIAGTEYDVAHVKWGGSWVMPSQDQLQELVSKCQYTSTLENGVSGHQFIGPSGCTIFFPESDFWRKGLLDNATLNCNNVGLNSETDVLPSAGYYWASTLRASNSSHASSLLFSNGYAYWDTYNYRSFGLTVRPVISGTTNRILLKSFSDDISQAVYNIQGMKVAETIADMNALPSGIYLENGRKRVVRQTP